VDFEVGSFNNNSDKGLGINAFTPLFCFT
jgi:hypothetical protein